MCIGSDKFLSGSLTRELTFRMLWNNIEGAASPACCELPHQCIYKHCITSKFASRPPDHPGRHSGSPGDLKVAFGDRATVFVQHCYNHRSRGGKIPSKSYFISLYTWICYYCIKITYSYHCCHPNNFIAIVSFICSPLQFLLFNFRLPCWFALDLCMYRLLWIALELEFQ